MSQNFQRQINIASVFLLGISSGLPLLLTGSTLQAWMVNENVKLSTIGVYSLVGLPYTLKFLWSPLLDRFTVGSLGRRRGWILVFQLHLAGALFFLGQSSPAENLWLVALAALLVAFFSASQDIVVDAWRRESFVDNDLGLASGLYVNGYRVGMLAAGAGALILADQIPWSWVYRAMALMMIAFFALTFFVKEPAVDVPPPKSMKEAVIEPFIDFFKRPGALLFLAFILLYKIGDNMAVTMTTPMYLKMGYTKTQIGWAGKIPGLAAVFAGGIVGGMLIMRWGIYKSLWIFGILQAISTAGFAILVDRPPEFLLLIAVIVAENLAIGMGTAAFVAFMATLTNKRFTATQYALLSSLMGVPRVLIAAPMGWVSEQMGFFAYFIFCGICAVPGLLLVPIIKRKLHNSGATTL